MNVPDKENLYISLFFSLYNTLHHEKTSPPYFFSKFCRNNLNSYYSKTNVIRTNFESTWGFELREFNCMLEVGHINRQILTLRNNTTILKQWSGQKVCSFFGSFLIWGERGVCYFDSAQIYRAHLLYHGLLRNWRQCPSEIQKGTFSLWKL